MGGENGIPIVLNLDSLGSSPRGRGKLMRVHAGGVIVGLIPAWAGKTRLDMRRTPLAGAHPRVGGENSASASRTSNGAGSSPRGRGKLGFCSNVEQVQGLIPAWAGKTASASAEPGTAPAHPRVGGENSALHFALS